MIELLCVIAGLFLGYAIWHNSGYRKGYEDCKINIESTKIIYADYDKAFTDKEIISPCKDCEYNDSNCSIGNCKKLYIDPRD